MTVGEWLAVARDGLFRGGTCDSEYVGGTGSGFIQCPAGKFFTSTNGNSTDVSDATCCASALPFGGVSSAREVNNAFRDLEWRCGCCV